MNDIIQYRGIQVNIYRSARRRSISLSVERDGQVTLRVPTRATEGQLVQVLEKRDAWLHKQLHAKSLFQRPCPPSYVDGESFYYLGRAYRLRLIHDSAKPRRSPLRLENNWFELDARVQPHASLYFARWYAKSGKVLVSKIVEHLGTRLGTMPSALHIRRLGYRWASCSAAGVLNVHWHVLTLPPRIIEYIIAHELAHLVEPNHSKYFWKVLERIMPDWAERKKWLDKHSALHF